MEANYMQCPICESENINLPDNSCEYICLDCKYYSTDEEDFVTNPSD